MRPATRQLDPGSGAAQLSVLGRAVLRVPGLSILLVLGLLAQAPLAVASASDGATGALADAHPAAAHPAAAHGHPEAPDAHPVADTAHGSAHGGEHAPTFDDVNWYYGLLGERDSGEPTLLYRTKGMPVPVAALVVNSALLFALLFYGMRRAVAEGLRKRKATIMQGMEDAAKMKAEAQRQLEEYRSRLEHIQDKIEEVKAEMKVSGEAERQRVLADAEERRVRMEREARRLIEHELQAAREELARDVVRQAVRTATERITGALNASDQARLAEEHIDELASGHARLSEGQP